MLGLWSLCGGNRWGASACFPTSFYMCAPAHSLVSKGWVGVTTKWRRSTGLGVSGRMPGYLTSTLGRALRLVEGEVLELHWKRTHSAMGNAPAAQPLQVGQSKTILR